MPFKIAGITASSVEVFKKVEDGVNVLNGYIETLNGVTVDVTANLVMDCVEVYPTFKDIKQIRVFPKNEILWTDTDTEKQAIYLKTKNQLFKINLTKKENS